ncbi:uncharacterized protein [Drosophila kikkawai]|uniref:Integrase catalytic domain-containing protein n=1 Tax=Drosophila kikkawai TaxID=30033 RepID=A0ABM4GQ97_DROKI
MENGDSEEPKPLLTVSTAEASSRGRATSESSVPSESENPSRSKSPLATTTPRKSTSTSLDVPPPAPSTKAAKSVGSSQVTRATERRAQAEGDKALVKFTTITDRMGQFEARFNTPTDQGPSIHTSRVRLEQIRALWDKVEREYEMCSEVLTSQNCKDTITVMQSKYDYCYTVYERCAANLNEIIEDARAPQSVQSFNLAPSHGGCRLPPVECEVFNGDYVQWPTFRDLFSAIYVCNPRLSEVEKLFHLNAKTSGEAKSIVALSPLTNDGFESAWRNLQNRFENKRLLVNSQLKILFNLPSVAQECGKSLKHLESTIQGCLTALQLARVETTNWDCLLVFLCSSKLPKLTLALWEQSLLTTQQQIQSTPSTSQANVQTFLAVNTQGVLLSTALIEVCHLGIKYSARALIDSGSEATFISERLFNLIKLPYESIQAQVSGVNLSVAAQPRKRCQLIIGSSVKPHIQIETCAYVLPQLAGNLPSYTLPEASLKDLPPLQLADPNFFRSSQIDVLIGADILPSILLSGSHSNICGTLLGQETIFGWILCGPIAASPTSRICSFSARLAVKESKLDSILTKFWEVEDVPVKLVKESTSVCEENFIRSTKRSEDGRYVVSLPFKEPDNIKLGHSRPIALAQYLRNEMRLSKDLPLKEQYDSVIREYLDLGHMHQVSPDDSSSFYLPHHAVFKPDSTTTKVRVVFNASNPSSNGNSLNDILHAGPVLQSDLTIQILKWRFFKYVFNADITKMYRQIRVNPDHTRFQRILFRNKYGELCDYELDTVTFGVNCAPFLAIRVLQQLAQDIRGQYPLASDIISNFMYVDDVLAGAHTRQSAVLAIKELRLALESAGFPLRKWTSNERRLLQAIPREHLVSADFLELEDASTAKTLGIRWQATSDSFFFVPMVISLQPAYTKREVLSQIAKLFDPAGWLSPFVIRAKIFMQEIWLRELGWDQPLPTDLVTKWQEFLKGYPTLREIRIPRWVRFHPAAKVQYHAFCDASQDAYGAAIFVRVETADGCCAHLLASKTRVAPGRSISIPRLELCGAVLLTELAASVICELPPKAYEIFYWTDSTIVLAWLGKPAFTWTTFVANRVAKIEQRTNESKWGHVRSEDNPADLASRGVSPQELKDSTLWWHGPAWLPLKQEQWPSEPLVNPETEMEQRPIKCHSATVPSTVDILERFSTFDRALRVLAYVIRFAKSCKKEDIPPSSALTSAELSDVQERLIVFTQKNEFPVEYKALSNKQQIPASSTISNLNPFLDRKGVLRASGRLQASDMLSYDEKHPIIIPARCRFAKLQALFTHRISLHGGNQLMVRLIRSKFWISKLQRLVKHTIHSCRVCVIHKKNLQRQLMGDLPRARSSFSRPFTHTGMDFAGPFDIKSYVGRGCKITKGYVCVFVCFSTRAIHLEATSDLTTEKFLAAFSRFSARRGCPQHVYSDNGKTFVGASTSLSRDFIESTRTLILSKHSLQNLAWHFNPPGAPHMGGLWEAGVKSFKAHFYKYTAAGKYTFEELATLLAKIEACLNSRPISPMSEDPTDLVALSPGHFLIGGPLLAVSEPLIEENPISIINRWRRLKALHQQFCVRWKEEYLKELHKRNKWKFPSRDLQAGDMVVIKEESLPANEWRLGRIQLVCPGADGKVRVADVLTARGVIRRPVAKMIRLPMDGLIDHSDSSID